MRITPRLLSACVCLFAAALLQAAATPTIPEGNWIGTVSSQQRNIVVKLDVGHLQLGEVNGEMRWGTPRECSLRTEYSGMRENDYTFNISGSDGGWCDLYRDGTLAVHRDPHSGDTLVFRLADRQQGELVGGTLSPAPVRRTAEARAGAPVKRSVSRRTMAARLP